MYDSAGESIDLLQTVRHQPPSSSSASSSVPVTSAAQHFPADELRTCKVSRRTERRASTGLGRQRAVTADVHGRRCSDYDGDDDDDTYVERATARHCHCCCQCTAQRHAIHQTDVTDVEEGGGLRRLRSALDDDDDSDPVSYIERHRLTTSGLYLPPLFVTPAARSGAQSVGETGHVSDRLTSCRQQATCFSRWWSEMFRRRRDVARYRHDNDEDDDCWRLFPSRHHSRAMSHDTGRRPAAEPAVASLCSSPAAVDDTVDVRSTSQGGDVVLLTQRCRRVAAANDKSAGDGRRRCTRVFCVILGGLCVAMVGLLVGGLVIVSPAASLHYSQ